MRCRGFVMLAVLLLCCPALAGSTDYDDCRYWRLGKDAADIANRLAACDRIIKGENFTPAERASAFASRADRASSDNRPADAIADFDQALALAPDASAPDPLEWRRDRAFLLHFANQHDRAVKDFDFILAAKSDNAHMTAHVTFFRGLSLLKKGDEARGFADLDKGIALAPQDSWYPFQRAVELVKRGKADEALPVPPRFIQSPPNEADDACHEHRGKKDQLPKSDLAFGRGQLAGKFEEVVFEGEDRCTDHGSANEHHILEAGPWMIANGADD